MGGIPPSVTLSEPYQNGSLRLSSMVRSHGLSASKTITPASHNALAVTNHRRQVHITPVKRIPESASVSTESPHGSHWVAERVVSAGLYAVLPAAYFLGPSFAMDTALTTSLIIHAHWGIASIFADYMHGYPSISGDRRYPFLTTLAKILPYVLSITAFACLMNFNYNDVGLVKAIGMLWRV